MRRFLMAAWVAGITGLIGVVLGIIATGFWQRNEQRQKFRVMAFVKRLTVHQEAFKFASDLGQIFFDAGTGQGQPDKEDLSSEIMKLKEWWRGNCLWLDIDSRKAILNLINSSETYIESDDEEDCEKCFKLTNEAIKCISEGIGEKYLPDVKSRTNVHK